MRHNTWSGRQTAAEDRQAGRVITPNKGDTRGTCCCLHRLSVCLPLMYDAQSSLPRTLPLFLHSSQAPPLCLSLPLSLRDQHATIIHKSAVIASWAAILKDNDTARFSHTLPSLPLLFLLFLPPLSQRRRGSISTGK